VSDLAQGGAGHCLCGTVRFVFDAAPLWQAHCHCESCRRATSASYTSYFGVQDGHWRWTGAEPARFASSPRAERFFCGRCGSPMAYRGADWPGEMHFFAASLDDPSAYRPTEHVHFNEHLAWDQPGDGLKRMRVPRRLTGADDFGPAIAVLRAAFASMDGVIDPPSSLTRQTDADLRAEGLRNEFWVMEDLGRPIATMMLTPGAGHLYLGKLATDASFRRQGLARQLVRHALARARALGLSEVRLQVRVELADNHATYLALGFVEVERTAHAGYDHPTSVTYSRGV
jgi:ribosomal protein S18 acetylase RimI-like enzyme